MSFLKKIFGKKEESIHSYDEFWKWFEMNEKAFFKVIKGKGDIEKVFFDKLSAKLAQLKDGYFYLTGMYDENTVELVLTADGNIKNIVFVEELINSAPKIEGWLFTALKPAMTNIANINISMAGCSCSASHLSFYSNDNPDTPDEIDITVAHTDLTEDNRTTITNSVFIFLDNFLGELQFATTVDHLNVINNENAEKELIPIEKLKEFLIWRQKEFVEKYEGVRHDTENEQYSGLEAELPNGNPVVAIINSEILSWDSKASHPWIMQVDIKYDGSRNKGMPDEDTIAILEEIENEICSELKDFEGYLNIGRQTSENVREIYFACKDFRKPSKLLFDLQKKYSKQSEISFDIYKDKYWKSFESFEQSE